MFSNNVFEADQYFYDEQTAHWLENVKFLSISMSVEPSLLISIFCKLIVLFTASKMKTIETKHAKQSSVKRVIYLTKKLKLNMTINSNKINVHMPIQQRNSKKSSLYLLFVIL